MQPAKNVLWFTGLPESGKTTIAKRLEQWMPNSFVIDGDQIRTELCSDLSFKDHGRRENIRRVSWVAIMMARAGITPIVALVSPYSTDRLEARARVNSAGFNFVEIYVNTPPDICELRDTKGHYKQARAGQIKNFTGVNAPYEPPVVPEIMLVSEDVDDNALTVIGFLHDKF